MREIKFRAWDKKRKQFVPNGEIVFSFYGDTNISVTPNDISYIYDDSTEERFTRFEVTQYTGLKDKNGVEIYEGDIIRDGSRLWKITISPIYGIFFTLTKGGHTRCYSDFASNLVDDFEVIGNIYEHSHLLDNN